MTRGRAVALFAGTGNPALADAVARELGVPLGRCAVERFPDGEVSARLDESVREREVFLLQPTSPPVNDHLVELLALADACRRAAAARVVAIVPYLGYARGDKREGRRVPVMASLVAGMIESAGIDHVVSIDVHTPQVEGFFHIPVDALSAVPALAIAIGERLPHEAVIVSPDLGGVRRATEYARLLGRTTASCDKRRLGGSRVAVGRVTGEVRGRPCVIVDDMIATGGTIVECARALRDAGAATPFTVVATHGILVPEARARLAAAGIRELVLTDTIPCGADEREPPTRRISVALLLAGAVRCIAAGESLYGLAPARRSGGDAP
ncbi:MAG TPA: ribose-phosphate pyrophosphokinase [Gemmatimonadaceae bacterium]